jgi:hypothetical protein
MNFVLPKKEPSLVLYLPLYELDGASFASRDAYGHLCTRTGALWTPSGHRFDGIDDLILAPDVPTLTPGSGLVAEATIEGWIYGYNAQTGANKVAFGHEDGLLIPPDHSDANYCGVLAVYGSDNNWHHSGGPLTITSGTWHHLVGVFNRGLLQTYLDGQLAKSNNAGSFNLKRYVQVPPSKFSIGGFDDREWWNCKIGEVRVYNRALNPSEIQSNYLATKWRYQ